MSRILVNTKNIAHEEWLRYRKLSIGGSDAAAVCGLNPYATPYTLWADKTGRIPPIEDNESMRQGRDLEDYVARRFQEHTGKRVRRKNCILQHDEYDYITANIDREVIGERAGLECKTTSIMNLKKFKNGEFPEQYYVQCMHYLAVTGYERWYLAVLILNSGFHVFVIERDEAEIAALLNAEKEFWCNHIVADIAPPVDGHMATGRTINTIFTDAGGECDLVGANTIESYLKLRAARKQIDCEIRKLEQEIKVNLGECEIGHCGKYTVKWRAQKRVFISKELLRQTYPKIDLRKVMKASSHRRFAVVNEEEKKNAAY